MCVAINLRNDSSSFSLKWKNICLLHFTGWDHAMLLEDEVALEYHLRILWEFVMGGISMLLQKSMGHQNNEKNQQSAIDHSVTAFS